MNKIFKLSLVTFTLICVFSCKNYKYETFENDPINARIYTLKNGLKVYMSVYDDQPRVQTYIAVKVGGKNDPSETTGLAHYFEHLMFKGTEKFGTQNYEAEKPLLDEIEQLFEVYRKTTDETERKQIYKKIDSVSYEASKIAIPNEYDKLMSAIGSTGTNAWTSMDATCYTENIPNNQIENWAKIQADRFANNVIRCFHTELETVYEEKNMSLTNDGRKVNEAIMSALFPSHPYGNQTVLGSQEHLKNPSITNIKKYHDTYYVPNNMAICLAGDFDPDITIRIIDKYFGNLKPNKNLPQLKFEKETPITNPIVINVYGNNAEYIQMAWRTNGMASKEAPIIDMIGSLLYNGKAGLIDIDLLQKQKILNGYGYGYCMPDYGMITLNGTPKGGQSLDNVKDLLLSEINKLKNGDFDEKIISSVVNNEKLLLQRQYDSNSGRANAFVSSFTDNISWKDQLDYINKLSKITKQDIVDYMNENISDSNYVLVYKHQGIDPNEQKIAKPQITPIATNRDTASAFLTEIKNYKPTPIKPVFLDYTKDLSFLKSENGMQVLYKKNNTTDLFNLNYRYDFGSDDFPMLSFACDYLSYLGCDKMSREELNRAFYDIACSFSVTCSNNQFYISLSGLNQNLEKALELFNVFIEHLNKNDEKTYTNLMDDMMKKRIDAKSNQNSNFNALRNYATYGKDYLKATTLPLLDMRLGKGKGKNALSKIDDLIEFAVKKQEYTVLYYGPSSEEELLTLINNNNFASPLPPTQPKVKYYPLITPENIAFVADYDANQVRYIQISNNGEKFNINKEPIMNLYQEYFGGGMNAIVFQEMREARGLAYSANASIRYPSDINDNYVFQASIATQNDKFNDAFEAFESIINDMPVSQAAFDIAKQGLISSFETQRITKSSVLWNYLSAKELGLDTDKRQFIYEHIKTLTLEDVVNYQQENIKNRKYSYCILGRSKDLDLSVLANKATIKKLSQEEIFGY